MKLACQLVLLGIATTNLLLNLRTDVEGHEGRDPAGFAGVIGSLLVWLINMLLLWGAGALSQLHFLHTD